MKKPLFICGICVVILAAVLFRRQSQIRFSDDTQQVEQDILLIVPRGSNVEDAKTTMERNGFTCSWAENKEFATGISSGRQTIHPKSDFLYCDREQGWSVSERWQVAIVHKNHHVVDVDVSYGLTGP